MRPGTSMHLTEYRLDPDARVRALQEALAAHARIAIGGGPRTGKTTLAGAVTDRPVLHTDERCGLPWSEQPAALIAACAQHDRFVVEGVQVARALRKGLQIDVLIWLVRPMAERTPQQVALAKGVATVIESIRAELEIPIVVVP